MLTTVKNKAQRTALIDLLTFIATSTQSTAGFAFVPKDEAEKLVKAEPTFVTLDASVVNGEGQIKAVATTAGIEALAAQSGTTAASQTTTTGTPEPMKFERIVLDKLPEINRGGNKSDSYPFAELAAPTNGKYDSFLVPATDAKPNPAKSLASTVASATKRYASTDKRVFTVRKHVVDGKLVGALVIRTA